MKKPTFMSLAAVAALALASASSWANRCSEDIDSMHNTGGPVTLFVKSTPGPGPSDITASTPPSTLLWDARFGLPAKAPDGHQLTLGEWLKASPRAEVNCLGDCTRIKLHATGLIPNGTYTCWVLVFDGPFGVGSATKPAPFGHLVGVGAAGPNDGSQNSFHANKNGVGELEVVMPPGVFSSGGPPFLNSHYDLKGCLLDEIEFHLVCVYHFDGHTYGPEPGFQNGGAEQFGVMFDPPRCVRSHIITDPPTADPVYDANGSPATRKTKALYSDSSGGCDHRYPILMPDGSPMPYSLFKSVKGTAKAECAPGGTLVNVKLRNLVPNGTYTLWVTAWQPGGVTPGFPNIIGVGALGAPDGSQNVVHASASGDAEVNVFHPAGPLSIFGNIGGCLLDEVEVQLWGAYHSDSTTHGPMPGGAGGFCDYTIQFGFDFPGDGDDDDDD
jgi:hypothetical protein